MPIFLGLNSSTVPEGGIVMAFEFNFEPQVNMTEPSPDILYDLLVVGGGPAGLNAALYAKRKGLETAILTRQIGGQVLNTSTVDNYLGSKESTGEELVNNFKSHVASLDIPVLEYVDVDEIVSNTSTNTHTVKLVDRRQFRSRALLLATGTSHRKLGVDGEERLSGRGVAYCAICDAPFYKNKNVIIAGGGNSAVEAAIDLAKIANRVVLVHRSQFRADKILVDELYKVDNIDIHLESQIQSIEGEQFMTHINVLDKKENTAYNIEADGIFVEIGNNPNSQLFKDIVELNDIGEIIVDESGKTSVEGIFAAGDVTATRYKQIIIATSEGAKAALAANDYINIQKAKERIEDYENVK